MKAKEFHNPQWNKMITKKCYQNGFLLSLTALHQIGRKFCFINRLVTFESCLFTPFFKIVHLNLENKVIFMKSAFFDLKVPQLFGIFSDFWQQNCFKMTGILLVHQCCKMLKNARSRKFLRLRNVSQNEF